MEPIRVDRCAICLDPRLEELSGSIEDVGKDGVIKSSFIATH